MKAKEEANVNLETQIPISTQYRMFRFKNPQTKRFLKVLKCDFEGCNMKFRKWHNLYDHLRIHTKERPYTCPFKDELDCHLTFTQRSNLNKHIKSHIKAEPRLQYRRLEPPKKKKRKEGDKIDKPVHQQSQKQLYNTNTEYSCPICKYSSTSIQELVVSNLI